MRRITANSLVLTALVILVLVVAPVFSQNPQLVRSGADAQVLGLRFSALANAAGPRRLPIARRGLFGTVAQSRFDQVFAFPNIALAARLSQRQFSFAVFNSSDSSVQAEAHIAPMSPSVPVLGSGTVGRLTMWSGFTTSISSIADSSISQDKFGNLGIGMDPTGSLLTVGGVIHSTGGFKFPDGTLMTSAGLSAVAHDPSLFGTGSVASPLGIAAGGVATPHLANGAVTAMKLGTTNVPGAGQVLGFSGSNLIWQTPALGTITGLTAGTGLTGGGTSGNVTLGIADSGVNTLQLGANAVTAAKIAPLQVVKSFNGLFDNITLTAGSNVTITPSGNTLTIASTGGLTAVGHNATLIGEGTVGSPLSISVPLVLGGSAPSFGAIIQATNTFLGDGVLGSGGGCSVCLNQGGRGVVGVGGNNGLLTGEVTSGGDGVSGTGGDGPKGGVGVFGHGGAARFAGFQGGDGVRAEGGSGEAIGGVGIRAISGLDAFGAKFLAGVFDGGVQVQGNFNVTGGFTKNFKIDHPLDPENKYLYHAAIESSEVLNVYSGNVTTDTNGDAIVELPNWFEAINRDFRYQLTVVGQFAQAIVANEVKDNRFTIKTNASNVRVSWQVTGVRSDPGALRNGFIVEEDKPGHEQGTYLNPAAYNQAEEKGVEWARDPEMMKQMKQRREELQKRHASQQGKVDNR